jgi:hypothetical protein
MANEKRKPAKPNAKGGLGSAVKDAAEAVGGAIAGAAEAVGDAIGGAAEVVGEKLAPDHDTAAGHQAARAHGRPATVDETLPATREELLELHAAARRRRAAAPLNSPAYRQAADEIGRIEIRIAAVERAQVPPRG